MAEYRGGGVARHSLPLLAVLASGATTSAGGLWCTSGGETETPVLVSGMRSGGEGV